MEVKLLGLVGELVEILLQELGVIFLNERNLFFYLFEGIEFFEFK